MRFAFALILLASLAACGVAPMPPSQRPAPLDVPVGPLSYEEAPMSPQMAARTFVQVVAEVEPVAEALCRQKRPDLNCDFQIVVDDRSGQSPNAFHTLDQATGRPLIGFNLPLIADARSADELAFVLGHEAGHHIAGHLTRTRDSAMTGAVVLGSLAAISGADEQTIQSFSNWGASVGARRYSKDFELEADVVGTVIAMRAGYDPVKGAGFFSRLPDPGDRFLGSHPPNAQRIEVVRRTANQLSGATYR